MKNEIKTEEFSREEISKALRDYQQAKGLSQREIATQCSVSDATINHMMNGKWENISDEKWRQVWNVIRTGKTPLFNTSDFAQVRNACKFARDNKLMIAITGDTGIGKTTALEAITRQRNTFYVCYKKSMNARQFLVAILREMGIDFDGTKYDMVNKIAEELIKMGNCLLLIDEAGTIPHTTMQYIKDLRDYTIKNAGIILSGMPYFETNLRKNAGKQKEGYAEFLRRIATWVPLTGLTRAEIKYICNDNDITNEEEVRNFYSYKKFGDLLNAILLYQIDLIAQLEN